MGRPEKPADAGLYRRRTGTAAYRGDRGDGGEVSGLGFRSVVIPGRREASNPESRDSPMCKCTSEVWSCGPSRNDGSNQYPPDLLACSLVCTRSRLVSILP